MNLGRLAPKSLLSLSRRCSNSQALESPGQLVQAGRLGPTGVSDPVGLGKGPKMCISTSSQVVLMLLVQGSHFARPSCLLQRAQGDPLPPSSPQRRSTAALAREGLLYTRHPMCQDTCEGQTQGPPGSVCQGLLLPVPGTLTSPRIPLLWTPSSQPWAEQLQCLGQDTSAGAYMSG